MISGKLGRLMSRSAITLAFAIGIGAAATLSPAHAGGHHGEWQDGDEEGEWQDGDGHHREWHDGHWGYWGWRSGAYVFIAEPYPYVYYAPPPPVVYEPPPPPVIYAPPPVVAPSFGVFIGIGHH
jgi:hypothetical protein